MTWDTLLQDIVFYSDILRVFGCSSADNSCWLFHCTIVCVAVKMDAAHKQHQYLTDHLSV